MIYEVVKDSARLFVTVMDGVIVQVESPTHPCFRAVFVGEQWADIRPRFESDGFLVHQGT